MPIWAALWPGRAQPSCLPDLRPSQSPVVSSHQPFFLIPGFRLFTAVSGAVPVWDASWILWFHWMGVASREATWVSAAAQAGRLGALWLGTRPCCGQAFVLFIISFIWPQKGQRERISKLGRVCAWVHECVNLSL